ncbi:MAG: hypothetical protein EP319_18020 [Deltaproteobacteria bacterium]|nr:MAG: hypothetical protein EP319_18020 [Deltaproteobacteria bacterium]
MKTTLILMMLALSFKIHAGTKTYPLDFNFKPEPGFFDHALKGIWKDIPSTSSIDEISLDDEGDLQAKIQTGSVILGPQGKKLFSFSPLGNNRVQLDWDLKELATYVRIRADWKVEILGARISKHEIFHVHAKNIRKARSIFELKFIDGEFKFKLISNTGFKFEEIKVESDDDDLVSWFLDKFKDDVQKFLNKEISDYLSGPKVTDKIMTKVAENLRQLENIDLQLSDYATDINLWFTRFDFEKERIAISVQSRFNETDTPVHVCAQEMIKEINNKNLEDEDPANNMNPGSVQASHKFIERIIQNMASLEIDENNDGHPDEPLFCFGYKDPDHSGELEEFDFRILGKDRKIKLKFWAEPVGKPFYKYEILKVTDENGKDKKDHLITMKMSAKVRIENVGGYPMIILKNNRLNTSFTVTFKLAMVEGKGLQIVPQSLSLDEFQGKIYYKASRFIPKVRVPFFSIRKKLETELFAEVQDSMRKEILIDEVLPALDMKVKVKNYELLPETHSLKFNVTY